MKKTTNILIVAILIITNAICIAQRPLERSEILSILKTLTANPQKAWIPFGTITATHEEQKLVENARNYHRMVTNTTVRFDGERFFWQIVVQQSSPAVSDSNLKNGRQFDLNSNTNRIFAWDGLQYTTYFRPINNATVKDAAKLTFGPIVNGPLTAGLIPWGYGCYTYEKLSNITSTAVENIVDNRIQIELNLIYSDGTQMQFEIDPANNYRVVSQLVKNTSGSITINNYGNFMQAGRNQIPCSIIIERYINAINVQNLVSSDLWNITIIDCNMPGENAFKVEFEPDALIEYHTPLANKTTMYRYANNGTEIDSESLLIDKLEIDTAGNSPQNCATVAIKYVCSKFGMKITEQQLADLIENSNNKTSLYAMRQFAKSKGLYARAVKTDLKTLGHLKDCKVILHIPGKSHYFVLGSIDSNYVRVIDLTSRKFFDRYSIGQFEAEWTNGTALIISDKPINSQQNLTEIDDSTLQKITGAGGFSCSRLLQNYGVIICDHPIGGLCGGIYEEFFERWTCEAAETGTCSPTLLQREQTTDCITDPYDPTGCTITGEWTTHFIRSCM